MAQTLYTSSGLQGALDCFTPCERTNTTMHLPSVTFLICVFPKSDRIMSEKRSQLKKIMSKRSTHMKLFFSEKKKVPITTICKELSAEMPSKLLRVCTNQLRGIVLLNSAFDMCISFVLNKNSLLKHLQGIYNQVCLVFFPSLSSLQFK